MDPDAVLDAAKEGSKALTKFEEIILKLYGPRNTRRQADADTYANEKKLELIRDNPDMDIVFLNGEMNAREKTPEVLARRAQYRELYDSIRQERNLENVFSIAADEIKYMPTDGVSDEDVDDDWIARFFSIVKDISSEDMQLIWGKILAGEVASPKSFSLKTLDIIRNMSKEDAEAFQRAIPLFLEDHSYYLPSNHVILEKYGTSFHDVLLLDECGLIDSKAIKLSHSVSLDNPAYVINGENVAVIGGYTSDMKEIHISVHCVTRAGAELYKVLSHTSNIEYFKEVAKNIYDRNMVDAKVSVHLLDHVVGDQIVYCEEPLASYEAFIVKSSNE